MATYSAVTALPYRHLERATAGLRAQLRLQLGLDELADWSTLAVDELQRTTDSHGRTWFEYRGTVTAS